MTERHLAINKDSQIALLTRQCHFCKVKIQKFLKNIQEINFFFKEQLKKYE